MCYNLFTGSDLATCVTDALLQPVRELEQATHWKMHTATEESGTSSIIYTPCSEKEQGARKYSLDDIPPLQVSWFLAASVSSKVFSLWHRLLHLEMCLEGKP